MVTRRSDLDQLAVIINNILGIVPSINADKDEAYFIQGAYGRVRLMRANGSVEVSPSLSKPALEMWMRAFIAGLTARA